MNCNKCNNSGTIYSCNGCGGTAYYDDEFLTPICSVCEILGLRYSVTYSECDKCQTDPLKMEIKEVAEMYRRLNFNITTISRKLNDFNKNSSNIFKTPQRNWTTLSSIPQSEAEFDTIDFQDVVGIGTVTKYNDLYVIDIDGCSDLTFLREILEKLGLPQNYEWVVESGSNNGYHIYLYGKKLRECGENDVVSTFPPKAKYEKYFDKMEFLWQTHCVLPPSVHNTGNRYKFLQNRFPQNIPLAVNRDSVYEMIDEYLDFKQVINGQGYGGLTIEIQPNEEFVSETQNVDFTKYLLDDIYCILDIETTGFPQNINGEIVYPEILQLAWVLTNSKGTLIKKKSFIVDSDFFIENDHSDILNIDFQVARIVGFPINEILAKFIEDLKISDFVVAHNTDFDLDILGNCIQSIYGSNPFSSKKIICTMKSTVDYCKLPSRYGFKYPKLSELYFKLFEKELSNSHNAEIDVLHTFKCFKKLKRLNII